MGSRALLLVATTLAGGLALSASSAAQVPSPCATVICGTGNTGTPIGIMTGVLSGATVGTPTPAPMTPTPTPIPTLVLPQAPAPAVRSSGALNNGSAPGVGYGPGAGSYPAGAPGFGPAINPGAEAGTYAGPNAGSIAYGAGTNPATGGGLFEAPSSTLTRPAKEPSPSVLDLSREVFGPGFGAGIGPGSRLEPSPTP